MESCNNTSLVEWLPQFFQQWSHITLAERLSQFFQQWPQKIIQSADTEADKKLQIDTTELAEFFNQLTNPIEAVQHHALSFNPWQIAKVSKKELRYNAILAWLLNPEGTHGFGKLPLQTFLDLVRQNQNNILEDYQHYCHIQTEKKPFDDGADRIDIEINSDKFLLYIEVKIDAKEQPNQISRYCKDALICAGTRHWAVVFLTPNGRAPQTCKEEFKSKVPCLSWRQLAIALESSLQSNYQKLLNTNKISLSRQIAAYSVFCFINEIRTF